eukprot:403348241
MEELYMFQTICDTKLAGNTFIKSKSSISGGGIYYELKEPLNFMIQNYQQNEAPYGKDYASYPTKLKLINEDSYFLRSLVSGQTLEIDILVGLFDQNDQIISMDSESAAQIFSNDQVVSVSGNTKIAQMPQSLLLNLKASHHAKKEYIHLAINKHSANNVLSIFNAKEEIQLMLTMGIGDLLIKVDQNRSVPKVIKEDYAQNVQDIQMIQFMGLLDQLIVQNASRLQLSFYFSLEFVHCCLFTSLISPIVMLAKQFNMRWPQNVDDMLTYFSYASSAQETLLSFDCLYLSLGYSSVSQNELKLILFGMLPIIFTFIGTLIWIIIKITIKRKDQNFSLIEKIEITAMIVNYLCYPQIITMMFSLFDCYQLDSNISYLKRDMDITCWNDYHNKLILSIGLPFIFVWTLLVPILLLRKIHRAKKNLDDKTILKIYGLYYIGLKDEVYYWELIVINLRKLLFITCSTILATQKAQFRGYLGLLVLFVNNQLCKKYQPFIDSNMNTLEYHASFASVKYLCVTFPLDLYIVWRVILFRR